MATPTDHTIFSGIQPSGTLHLGNYLGAIKQWVDLQADNQAYYCIVDLHAITVPYDPEALSDRVLNAAATYLAAGLDPTKSIIFVQSHIPAHTELAWLLSTQTPFGELSRMTQFKDKSTKQADNTTVGLFAYPTLMAADILLYQANLVPVGEDQTQHIELTRDIAKRFNNAFGDTFTLPKAHVPQATARIMSLQDPTKKMSKRDDNPKSYLALTDDADLIRKKIMSAVTDTDPIFSFEQSGPAVKNLLTIYQAVTDKDQTSIEQEFASSGYKEFKEALADAVISHLKPIQETYQDIRADEDTLRVTLGRGMHTASAVATRTLHTVKEKMGLL